MALMGGLLTVTAFFLWGVRVAAGQREALEALDAMLSLLRELSARLSHRREGLKGIFAAYRHPLLESYGFLPLLREHDGREYPALWEAALERLPLPSEALPHLQALGSSLGRLPFGAQTEQLPFGVQTEQLSLCITLLEGVQKSLKTGAFQKRKSTVALWTLGGLLVALLLL